MQAYLLPRKEDRTDVPYIFGISTRRAARYPEKPLEMVTMMIDYRHFLTIEYKMNDTDNGSSYRMMNGIKSATMYSEMGEVPTLYQVAIQNPNYPIHQVHYFRSDKYEP